MTIAKLAAMASVGFFVVFIADVLAGAFWNARFLTDVSQMLMLCMSCLFFVVLIIQLEGRDCG